jgi:hypothetical protein
MTADGSPPLPPIWMPPNLADAHKSRGGWDASYGAHARRLLCCCQNPTAKNCSVVDLGGLPSATPTLGVGPDECP